MEKEESVLLRPVSASIEKVAFIGASWLAIFKVITQVFSWGITIIVARILTPSDYGLMAMSTIITGFAEMFSELGLGAAIIQRSESTKGELSSVFWFSLMVSLLFGIGCFGMAYPTAYIFDETRVIPVTQTVSVIFLISGLQIVPLSLLKKELNFKRIGIIEMLGALVSCSCMVLIASLGGGVWTLVLGVIILGLTKLVLVYLSAGWRPELHFNFNEAKEYVKFGVIVAIGGSFRYVFEKADRFFGGRAWSSEILGYYTFALQLSMIPMEKVVVLINQVSFSAFSKLQNEKEKFNNMYLNISKLTASLVLPLFVCGFLMGEELVKSLLNDKWLPIIFVFRFLCLAQILTALNAVNNFVHTAQGRPEWRLYFYGSLALLMSVSFYFAVRKGLNAVLIPWFSTYLILCLAWMAITLRRLDIRISAYLRKLGVPFLATMIMSAGVMLSHHVLLALIGSYYSSFGVLVMKVAVASFCYITVFLAFDRKYLYSAQKLLRG